MNREAKYYDARREDLIKFIPYDARHILEVGCGIGSMGVAIKEARGMDVEVIGIEISPEASAIAKSNVDKLIIGNVEEISLPFKKEYFDCIVYGDVLEHLIDPWNLLKKHYDFLKQGGHIIASIPNIAHYRIIKMLKKKEWNYRTAGILDKSHLRFFTLKSIEDMFKDADMTIVKIEHKIGASKVKRFLNKILLNSLLDYLTEQYIVIAQKK